MLLFAVDCYCVYKLRIHSGKHIVLISFCPIEQSLNFIIILLLPQNALELIITFQTLTNNFWYLTLVKKTKYPKRNIQNKDILSACRLNTDNFAFDKFSSLSIKDINSTE